MTGAAMLVAQRCNPYGHETGGPKHLLGGLYGPEHEGPQKWHCTQAAPARYRMVCRCGHRGQEMWLCDGHRSEIGRRQAGLCPPCAWPPQALTYFELGRSLEADLAAAHMRGEPWDGPYCAGLRTLITDAAAAMDELAARGLIHRCALTLEEVS